MSCGILSCLAERLGRCSNEWSRTPHGTACSGEAHGDSVPIAEDAAHVAAGHTGYFRRVQLLACECASVRVYGTAQTGSCPRSISANYAIGAEERASPRTIIVLGKMMNVAARRAALTLFLLPRVADAFSSTSAPLPPWVQTLDDACRIPAGVNDADARTRISAAYETLQPSLPIFGSRVAALPLVGDPLLAAGDEFERRTGLSPTAYARP